MISLYKKLLFISLFNFSILGFGKELAYPCTAKSAIVMNAETGAILYQKNPRELMHPSSTTKIATALYVISKKRDSLHEFHTATWETVGAVSEKTRMQTNAHPPYRLEYGGTHMGIKVGERLSIRDLLYGLMIVSANDASNMLAQYTSGSIPRFMLELNGFVKELGCKDTTFLNPHGLPHKDHLTTAYDLALLAKFALKDPLFREIAAMKKMTRSETNKQPMQILQTNNLLLRPGKYYYPQAIGVKSGTTKMGVNIVAAAEIGSRTLIAVLLGCKDNAARYQETIDLFNLCAKEQKVTRTLFSSVSDVFQCQVKQAKKPILAKPLHDITIEYYPSEERPFTANIVWKELKLPIEISQEVGILEVLDEEGKLLASSELVSMNVVKKKWSIGELVKNQVLKRVLITGVLLALVGLSILFVIQKKLLAKLYPRL